MNALPQHLKKYIVEQDYTKYTSLDQAVWRYVLRQLKHFLSEHAYKSYLNGLEQTGIEIDCIPKISDISARLEKLGWQALPVSGFIPPAAFMELQSLSILPIASDMRSIDHLMYTPAPDIVHEAAGHAPFLADEEYANYLKQYAQVAKKAIISREDYELYQAIRELSDIKENPNSTEDEILASEEKLKSVSEAMTFVSEGAELSRMNWWTAEYGLIGNITEPKIYGAGLLSSVGESQWCLSEKVKKFPLTLDCIKQSYDITEPQPQLFVAKDFKHLSKVLEELSMTMAYRLGGQKALEKAVKAESVNTVEFENRIQISGLLKKYLLTNAGQIAYLQFSGPTQICYNDVELEGHDKNYHLHGYGTPVGAIKNIQLSELKVGVQIELQYESGVHISGTLSKVLKISDKAQILSFENATCKFETEVLFQPEWGTYDIVAANEVSSVFGGPADRAAYGAVDDFMASRVTQPTYSPTQLRLFANYSKTRQLRDSSRKNELDVQKLFMEFSAESQNEWLLFLELFEIAAKENMNSILQKIETHLINLANQKTEIHPHIMSGLKLAREKY